MPAESLRVRSTKLLSWSKNDRQELLSHSPVYYDVTEFNLETQIPRPDDGLILKYLSGSTDSRSFADLLCDDGGHILYVAAVARNYIGLREEKTSGTHQFRFHHKQDLYRALLILSSDLFFSYWKTVGDGFHLTKGNIVDFPISDDLYEIITPKLSTVYRIWKDRIKYQKTKINSGLVTNSYDLSKKMPSLKIVYDKMGFYNV